MKSLPQRLTLGTRPVHLSAPAYLIFVVLLFCCTVTAQIGLRPVGTAEAKPIEVKGKVVNSLTGEAIPRALVTMGARSMLTDSDGAFAFEGAQAQGLYFQVQKPGYFSRTNMAPVKAESADNVLLKLEPDALIHGKVVDETGEPIEDANIRVFHQQIINGKRDWRPAGFAQSRDDGSYRIPNLRPGKYILAVAPSQRSNSVVDKKGYALTYFPKAPDRASAAQIQMAPGEQSVADFELSPVVLHKISGVVTGPKTLATNIQVVDASDSGLALMSRVDPTTGEFELRGVPRGRYLLRATGFIGGGQEPFFGSTTVNVANDMTGVVVVLHEFIRIPIETRLESTDLSKAPGQQTEGANVQAVLRSNPQITGFSNQEGPPESPKRFLRLQDGGTYDITVTSQRNSYVRSARCGSTDLLKEPLVVPASGLSDPIEVVFRNDGGRIQAAVRNAEGTGLLIAVPDSDSNQPAARWGFAPQMKMPSPNLAPGGYNIYAFQNAEEVEYENRDALKAYRSKAVHVTISANQTAEIELEAIDPER